MDRPGPERRRGQVWWGGADKRRPILLLSRPEAYAVRRRVIAAKVTTTIRLNPATVPLSRGDGLPEPSIANCDNLVTANQDDLIEYITTLSPERMGEIERALRFALALDQ